jgi:hypothetical protein
MQQSIKSKGSCDLVGIDEVVSMCLANFYLRFWDRKVSNVHRAYFCSDFALGGPSGTAETGVPHAHLLGHCLLATNPDRVLHIYSSGVRERTCPILVQNSKPHLFGSISPMCWVVIAAVEMVEGGLEPIGSITAYLSK